MPNGGPRPDCIHCKNYRGGPLSREQPFCEYHKINLSVQLYAFCADYGDFEPHEKDWLDEKLDREQLQKDMIYVWLGGYEVKHYAVPLVSIVEYGTWTSEQFYDELHKIIGRYQNGTDSD